MKNLRHLFIVAVCAAGLLIAQPALAQLSYYYENGKSAALSLIAKQKGSKYVTQMTYYSYDFVSSRVHDLMGDDLSYEPFEQAKTTKQGEFEIITRKYKSKFNSDLAPDRRFIQTEYKTAVIEGERVIVSARFSGLEDYVGKFYGAFWLPELNAKAVKSGEMMSHDFLQDHVSVQVRPDGYRQMVWIEISNKEIKDFSKFKTALANKIKADKAAALAFNTRRSGTVFQLKEVGAADYEKIKTTLDEIVKSSVESGSDGSREISLEVNVDTTGKLSVKSNDADVMKKAESQINYLSYNKYKEKGVYMFTSDKFTYNTSSKSENGSVFLKKEKLDYKTENSADFKQLIETNKAKLDRGRGIYGVSAKTITINGNSNNTVVVNEFKEKKSPGKLILGGALIAGVGAYYIMRML